MRIKLKLFLISILISLPGLSIGDDVTLPQLAFDNLEQSMRVSQDGLNLLNLSTNRSSDSLEYSLGGVDAAYFTVDSEGQVLFKKPHNYKEQSSYRLTFTVDDTSDMSASGEATFSSTLFLVVREGPLYEDDHWEPSRIGACEYYENVSPALDEITLGLTQNNDPRAIFEPTQIFDDETTTLMASGMESNESTISFDAIKPYYKFRTIDGDEPDFLYDDGTHGDLVAGDGVWTLSCLRPEKVLDELDPIQNFSGLDSVFNKYRGTEPSPEIITSELSVNDTGFFYKSDRHYRLATLGDSGAWGEPFGPDPDRNDALKQIWDHKGSIFNFYALSSTHDGWPGGMMRIHDFIGGTGATQSTPCNNYSHCYSFSDGRDHPELIAGITINSGPSIFALGHEIKHGLIGFTMKDFPEANAEGACDRNPDCSRELSIDYAHIEANTTLNSVLKGPPWNPEFGYPHSIRIRKSDGSTTEPNVIYDDEDEVFKVVERTREMQFRTSDFFLYHQGLISAEQAMNSDYYKLVGYTFPGCDVDNKERVCPDGYEFPYEESIKFNVSDSIAKFGGYSNPRGLDVYDPANITLAMIQVSGRNHTEAEYTIDSKIYRSWGNDGPDVARISFDHKVFQGQYDDPPWKYTTRGLGNIVMDFSSRIDTDSDGLPNDCDSACIKAGLIEDTDDDDDGVLDGNDDAPLDPSNDSDGDGAANNEDVLPLDNSETLDADLDGIGNNADTDDDNDTVLDTDDAFPLDASESADADDDGVGDNADAFPNDASETMDSDLDNVGDNADNCVDVINIDQLDTDSDSLGNACDSDDDNDGVNDEIDALPLDASEQVDTDSDGIGNIADTDDDGDSVLDGDDAFPIDEYAYLDTDGDGKADDFPALLATFVEVSSLETSVIETVGPIVAFSIDLDQRAVITFTLDDYPEDCSVLLNSVSMKCDEIIITDPGEYTIQLLDSYGDGGISANISIQELTPADVSPAGTVLDDDDDNDGVLDVEDTYPLNDQYSADSDQDGIADKWETNYGLDPNDASDAASDQDNDGVTALDEFLAGTVPVKGSLDLDGNENYDALTDGLLLLRGMFGLNGSALVTGAISSDGTFTESVDVESRIANLGDLADIDGNGEIDALTDGLLTLRYLFGLEGDTLINGVVAADATRKTAEEIEAHLETLMPAL